MSTASRPRVAVSVMPLENRRDVLTGLAIAADRLGYDGFFLPEAWGYDTTVLLADAAARTQRITLGTGILGVWGRSAAAIAMVRALLRGDRVPLAAMTSARALKLNALPAPDVPIYLAALADESVRLAGELADGWLPFLYPLSQLPGGERLLREGAARSGDPGRTVAILPSLPTVVADDPQAAHAGAAWFVAFYLTTMGPLYRASLMRQGFDGEVAAVLAANAPRFTGAVPPEADRLLEELTVFGTPEDARARLARWHAGGATSPPCCSGPT